MFAIEAKNVGRSFKRSIKAPGLSGAVQNLFHRQYAIKDAVREVSFNIREGSFTGLVGPNGAGKTTLLKMCSGLIHPTRGSLSVLGFEPAKRRTDFLKSIGMVMGQKSQLWTDISPRDSLELFAAIYDIPKKEGRRRVDQFAELFDVTKLLGVQVRRLSLGERMKFELIAALLHEPKVLFLDEPTIGLDLFAKDAVRKFLTGELRRRQVTLILSSHDMEDIQEVCENLMVIAGGQIKFFGTVSDFKSRDPIFKDGIMRILAES